MALRVNLMVLIVLTLFALSYAHIGGHSEYQNVRRQYYCGRSLARAVALVCYDDLPNEKRAKTGTMYNAVVPPNREEGALRGDWPRIPAHQARGMGLPYRGKRFIVSECCDKPCSVEELLTYCG